MGTTAAETGGSGDRVLVFANPIAGRGRGRRLAGVLAERLRREGFDVVVHLDPVDQVDVAAELSAGPVRCVVAIGGDGTLRGVAERLIEAVDPPADPPPLLVVPLGTANLMGRHLGVPSAAGGIAPLNHLGLPDPLAVVEQFAGTLAGSLAGQFAGLSSLSPLPALPFGPRAAEGRLADAVASAIVARRTVSIDLAAANGRLFLLMAGVGLDAHVVHALDAVRVGPIARASYLRPAAVALRDYAWPSLTVFADGRRAFGPAPALAFVGNVPEYGTGFPVLPRARSDDGRLDLCVLPCASPEQTARLFLHAAAGEHLGAEGVVYLAGRSYTIDADRPTPVQVDGEPSGHTPLEVRLLDRRLPLIVPG